MAPSEEEQGVESLAQLIARLRTDRGLSMEGLAAAAGLSQETISAIERGEDRRLRSPTRINLFRALASTGPLSREDAVILLDKLGLSRDLYERSGARSGGPSMVAFSPAGTRTGLIGLLNVLVEVAGAERAEAMLAAMITASRVSLAEDEPPHEPHAPHAAPAKPGAPVPAAPHAAQDSLPSPPAGSVAFDAPDGVRVYEPVQRGHKPKPAPARRARAGRKPRPR